MSLDVEMHIFFNKKVNQQELKEAIDIAFKEESVSIDYFIRKDRDFNNVEILSGITFQFMKWSIRFSISSFEEGIEEVNFIVLFTPNSEESRKYYDALDESKHEELLIPLSKMPICRGIGSSNGYYDLPIVYTEFEQGLLKTEMSWYYIGGRLNTGIWPDDLEIW
jgi:hypothetical protein